MKISHNLKTIICALVCAACFGFHLVAKEPQKEKLEQFIDAISFRADFGRREKMKNRLESFEDDIAPYVRATITNKVAYYRKQAIRAISATENTDLLPLIVDRALNDEDKSVRSFALTDINWFLEQSSPEDLFDQHTVDMLGSVAIERMYLSLLANLKYTKAKDFLVDHWHETEGGKASDVLEALYAIDPEKADELLLDDGTREKLRAKRNRRETAWFLALARSARHNDRSLELVKNIFNSISNKDINPVDVSPDVLAAGALRTNKEECRQWVFDILKSNGEEKKYYRMGAALVLRSRPTNIIKSPDEEQALIDVIKGSDQLMSVFAERKHESTEKGTIAHWLTSPDSPLHKDTRERD